MGNAGGAAARQAQAEDAYPSRAIRIVTPLAAARHPTWRCGFCREAVGALRRPGMVQNQPGGGGVIAGRAVTNAPPDGYNIAWAGNNTAIGVSLFREPLDPRLEMKPIVGVSEFAYLFVDAAASPYKTLQAMDRCGAGEARHVERRNVERRHHQSPRRAVVQIDPEARFHRGALSRADRASVALLRNEVDLVINAYGGLRSAIEAKQVRALAVTSAARIAGAAGRADDGGGRRARFRGDVVECALRSQGYAARSGRHAGARDDRNPQAAGRDRPVQSDRFRCPAARR